MDLDSISVHKHTKKELGQYPAIFTSCLVNTYLIHIVALLASNNCVVPENIHTSPTEGIFFKTLPLLWKFQLSLIHFFKCFGLQGNPQPPGNSNPFCGRSMDIF